MIVEFVVAIKLTTPRSVMEISPDRDSGVHLLVPLFHTRICASVGAVDETECPWIATTVAAAAPGPVAVTSPVNEVIAPPTEAAICACKFSKAVRIELVAIIGVLEPATYPVNN